MQTKRTTKRSINLGFPVSNVTFIVEDQRIHVNKATLSGNSPVFNAMFNGHFKERTAKEIVLQGKKAADVVEFLKFFHPMKKQSITEDNVLQILPLAHEYQCDLLTECENFMTNMCKPNTQLTVSTLLDFILTGEMYGLTRFLKVAVEFCTHVDFELLNGKRIQMGFIDEYGNCLSYHKAEDYTIAEKFLEIESETRYAIAEKRLQYLEWKTKLCKSDALKDDYTIPLS